MATVIDRAVAGEFGDDVDALNEAFDHAVEIWHAYPDFYDGHLHSFLGLTSEEYATWVENAGSLVSIVENRRREG